MEYLTQAEAVYLAGILSGESYADTTAHYERDRLIAKLLRLKTWAEREEAAQARLNAL
ncbi:hypothetical protein UFOVP506_13 [uncultured Caudovirales phage]|uniref:Uncharacterized protein n=1 Tax=uncultured Caudovirales phage TaxID=2100421 RepID=A0A6J5MQ22_9CAUD|nr:hypothetical protein UFOVP506_13 [uncultured Caudovirales phage]